MEPARQLDEIIETERGAIARGQDEGIGSQDIGPSRGQALNRAVVTLEVHAVLSPSAAVVQERELASV
jgi:hypothetical protein